MNSARRSKPTLVTNDMPSGDDARQQTRKSLERLVTQLSGSAREELDTLRVALDKQIAAVEASLESRDHGESLETLVQELSRAAAEQAEEAASQARLESQETAQAQLQAQLAVAHAEAQKKLDAEVVATAVLRKSLDETRKQLEALRADAAALQAARGEIEASRKQAEAAKKELAAALAKAQQDATEARRQAEASGASLDMAQAQLDALEKECKEARDLANIATAETQRGRDEVDAATRYALAMKGERDRLETEVQALLDRGDGGDLATLDRVSGALRAFESVTDIPDVLETLVAQLGQNFTRAAIFLVKDHCLEGWHSAGLDSATNINALAIPLTVASPLTRAVTDEMPVTLTADSDDAQVGVFGTSVRCAIAVPVFADGTVIAVAYAEHPEEAQGDVPDASLRIAEILGCHASRCLTGSEARALSESADAAASLSEESKRELPDQASAPPPPPAAPQPAAREKQASYPGPPRVAPRIAMPEGVEIVVDSTVCQLVNLSSSGAQIRAPRAMRPNHIVRILLPKDEGTLLCKGRIVWAVFEMARAGTSAMYRAGLQFTEVDEKALEKILSQRGGSSYKSAARR